MASPFRKEKVLLYLNTNAIFTLNKINDA